LLLNSKYCPHFRHQISSMYGVCNRGPPNEAVEIILVTCVKNEFVAVASFEGEVCRKIGKDHLEVGF